jgi:hypothetical protein
MAHVAAARNDERLIIFKIILRRLLLVFLQLGQASQALDECQPPLSRSNSLAILLACVRATWDRFGLAW